MYCWSNASIVLLAMCWHCNTDCCDAMCQDGRLAQAYQAWRYAVIITHVLWTANGSSSSSSRSSRTSRPGQGSSRPGHQPNPACKRQRSTACYKVTSCTDLGQAPLSTCLLCGRFATNHACARARGSVCVCICVCERVCVVCVCASARVQAPLGALGLYVCCTCMCMYCGRPMLKHLGRPCLQMHSRWGGGISGQLVLLVGTALTPLHRQISPSGRHVPRSKKPTHVY